MTDAEYINWQNKIKRGALRDKIMDATNISTYDHRLSMSPDMLSRFPHMAEEDVLQYARFKEAVARVLLPRTVYEVGVGYGIAAKAFLEGAPNTRYFGIDNVLMGVDPGEALDHNPLLPYRIVDSSVLSSFVHPDGDIDLIHVDAAHDMDSAVNDVEKALQARPEWLLVDDVHNVTVAAGTFTAFYRMHQPELEMMYFENSHTGSLLAHIRHRAPENRSMIIEKGLL